jgi:hypothetical protein
MLDRREVIRLGFGAVIFAIPGVAEAQANGAFSANPLLESLQGKLKKVREEFRYRDPGGTLWTVPENYVSDGASIPRILWTAVGGPWDGSYDDAAIIHDYYCDTMKRTWEATHQVFYDAMRSRGLSKSEATKKYWAVYSFGPRWDAQFRWTSAWGYDKRPRRGRTFGGGGGGGGGGDHSGRAVASIDGDSADRWADASADSSPHLSEEEFLALQAREFARASQLIDGEQLGPEDVPQLAPGPPR